MDEAKTKLLAGLLTGLTYCGSIKVLPSVIGYLLCYDLVVFRFGHDKSYY